MFCCQDIFFLFDRLIFDRLLPKINCASVHLEGIGNNPCNQPLGGQRHKANPVDVNTMHEQGQSCTALLPSHYAAFSLRSTGGQSNLTGGWGPRLHKNIFMYGVLGQHPQQFMGTLHTNQGKPIGIPHDSHRNFFTVHPAQPQAVLGDLIRHLRQKNPLRVYRGILQDADIECRY
jgi:hypothetical protein